MLLALWMPFWGQASYPVVVQEDDERSTVGSIGTEAEDDDDAVIEGEDPLADIRKLRFYNKKSVAKKVGILTVGTIITGGVLGGLAAVTFLAFDAAANAAHVSGTSFLGGKGGNAFLNKVQYKKLFKLVEASYIHQGLLKARTEEKHKHARGRIHDFYIKYVVDQYPTTRLTEEDVAKQFVKAHKVGLFSDEVKQKIKHERVLTIVPEVFALAKTRGYSDYDLVTNPEPGVYKAIKHAGWMKMVLSHVLFYKGSLTPVAILQEQYEVMSKKAQAVVKKDKTTRPEA